jgi:sterol desaturase/sphingolipid hydroxylase (fatty acid hydroxylase superfamily)
VLFPPIMLVFFFGLFAVPVGLAFYVLLSPNIALLFVLTSAGYFLNYELLHFSYHMDERSWIGRLPFMGQLRSHHTAHHNRRLMDRYNFNITYPIFDAIFGTIYRPDAQP